MRHFKVVCLVFVGALSTGARAEDGNDFRFANWWTAPGERRAVKEIAKFVQGAGISWRETVVNGEFDDLRALMLSFATSENAPDAVQWMAGKELREMARDGVVRPLPFDGAAIFKPEVWQQIALPSGEGMSGLPLGIHTENFVAFNKDIYDRVGLPLPQTMEEMAAQAPIFAKQGIVPLVISDQPWQIKGQIDAIFSSLLDAEHLSALREGRLSAVELRAVARKAFSIYAVFAQYKNADYRDLRFDVAARKLSRGEAAAMIQGDFSASELLPGPHYVCHAVPGAQSLSWTIDGMAFLATDDATRVAAQNRVVDMMIDSDVLTRYVGQKSGVSVLRDPPADQSALNDCIAQIQDSWEAFEGRRIFMDSDFTRNLYGIAGARMLAAPGLGAEDAADLLIQSMRAEQ